MQIKNEDRILSNNKRIQIFVFLIIIKENNKVESESNIRRSWCFFLLIGTNELINFFLDQLTT